MKKPELIAPGYVATEPNWRLGPQVHDRHELIVISGGKMYVELGGKHYSVGTGDVLLYRKGVMHIEEADPADPVVIMFLTFRWEDVPEDMPDHVVDMSGRMRQLIMWLHQEFTAGGRESVTVEAFFEALMAEWMRLAKHKENPIVEAVRSFVWRNIGAPVTLGKLAQGVGLSKYHFSRTYKKITGRAPMTDVREMRVNYAKGLVLSTRIPLKIIARLAGLGDEYRLSRVFMEVLGTRPGELRKAGKA